MAGLQITITDAGRAALPNGPNTGTSAVTISHVGVSSVNAPGPLKGLTALPGEVKRVSTFGGDIVADDVIHITINDETTDVYSVRSFGLYLSTGVLFAVFSSPDVVVEKSAGAMVLLSADITFKTLDTAVIQFGGTGFINPPATTERLGVVELATSEEAAAGLRSDLAVTPYALLKTLQAWGANVAGLVHRHVITSIDGLPEALASKSAVGHKHDASDTNSGVFDVGRIPALGMEKITGLAIALANRAALIHGHVMSDIDGLVQALNGKSAVGHKHDASDTNSGVFDVGRIPALAMEKITGLAMALALKASLGAAVRFASVELGTGNSLVYGDGDRVLARTGAAGAEKYFGFNTDGSFVAYNGHLFSVSGRCWDPGNFNPATKATLGETVTFGDVRAFRANGTGVVYLGDLSHYLFWDGANYNLPAAPLIVNGGVVHTTATFNPATKADATNPVFFGEMAFASGDVRERKIGANGALYIQAGTDANFNGRLRFTGLLGADLTELSVQMSGGLRNIWHTGNLAFAGGGTISDPNLGPNVHDQMISPAGLWSFARNLGSPGYAVIPGTGLMVQWGISVGSIPEGETHAVLPVAFGGGCLVALANPRNPGRNINSDFYMQVVGHFVDRIAFFANRANGSAGNVDGFEWVALGRVSGGTPDPAYSSGGSGGIGGGGGGGGGETTNPV